MDTSPKAAYIRYKCDRLKKDNLPPKCGVYRYVTYKRYSDDNLVMRSKIYRPSYKVIDRSRKGAPCLRGAVSSVQRAHNNLYDVLACNQFSFFITLTFGDDDRIDDQICRVRFSSWRKDMRSLFPSMFYVAVPEYHKKGTIHYHVVVGGVLGSDLGLVDSGRVLHHGKAWRRSDFIRRGFKEDLSKGEGATVYNVTAWTRGYSTATEIRSCDAVIRYVSKYLTKSNVDPRFYNKKRFYTSHNIKRPEVVVDRFETSPFSSDRCQDIGAQVSFYNDKRLLTTYDSAEDIIRARLAGLIPMPKHDLPF